MKNKGMIFLISVCVYGIVFCSFMAGRLYESVSMLGKIVVEDEGILVGIGPTDAYNIGAGSHPDQAQYLPRDYSNYSDPYMLSQGASYNTDPNIMWSLEVSDPNLIRSWKRKPEQR